MPIHDAIRQRLQPVAASVTSHRILLYAVLSTCAMFGAIANACIHQSNFYSVMIHLSRSGRSVLILANFGFLSTLFFGRIMQRVFFGPLQPREVERLYDQTWMFVTESLLAFTIFRDEFDIPFVLMFGFLLFIKCFHWLMADRVDSMDQFTYPGPPGLFHVRMIFLVMTLSMVDFAMFMVAVDSTLDKGVGGMVLFATEYAILIASTLNAVSRYTLTLLEYRRAQGRGGENAPPWDNKSMYVFYIELVTDFLKLTTYLTFFTIILTFYGLPLNIIRDVYITARSFITRLRALIRYHNATRDMERRYPTPTEEELVAMSDRTCIICREELTTNAPAADAQPDQANGAAAPPPRTDGPNMTPKKLPCGHVFHFQCLRSWLERQQSCPTCRRPVLENENRPRNGNQPQNQQRRQQPNGAARPPAPQPGAAPQAFQPVQPRPPFPPPNESYFMRFVRRALGLNPQPLFPPFPNQFGPQQLPQMPPYGYGPPPPPGYHYNPYHPYPAPPPHQQLQAAPVVRGFYGPGGVWHPWPLEQDQNNRGQNPPPAPTPSAAQPQPHSEPLPAPGAVPVSVPLAPGLVPPTVPLAVAQNRAASPSPPTESTSSMSSVSSTDEEGDDTESKTPSNATTPREAAAQAALRRLGVVPKGTAGKPSSSSSSGVSSSVELRPTLTSRTSTAASSSVPVPTPTTSQPQPTPTTQPVSSASEAAPSTSTSTSTSTSGSTPRAPALLPLYDPSRPVGSQGINYIHPHHLTNPYMNPNVPYAWRPAPGSSRTANANSGYPFPQARPSPYPSASQSHQPRSSGGGSSSRSFRPNLSTLPSTLTDEQLSRLDRLTRDAIDERLRVLEGVSSAVHRCIEELTRVRSVLPPGSVGSALSGAPMGQPPPSNAVVSTPPETVPCPSGSGSVVASAAAPVPPPEVIVVPEAPPARAPEPAPTTAGKARASTISTTSPSAPDVDPEPSSVSSDPKSLRWTSSTLRTSSHREPRTSRDPEAEQRFLAFARGEQLPLASSSEGTVRDGKQKADAAAVPDETGTETETQAPANPEPQPDLIDFEN